MHIIRTIFLTAFLLFVFLLTGNARKSNTNANLESVKYHHFLAAVTNQSTFGYFTVILVKDLNTGIVKEICTKGNFLSGAVHTELKADYDASGERNVLQFIKSRRNRYFKFRDKAALANLSFYEYNSDLVTKTEHDYDFDSITATIKTQKKFSIRLKGDAMKAFAHVLFNRGYLSGENDCWGGTLEYVDKP